MPKIYLLARNLKEKLLAFSSEERAQQVRRYFKTLEGEYGEGDKFIGVSLPQIRILAKESSEISMTELKKMVKSPIHEERLLGFIICVLKISEARKKKDEDTEKEIVDFVLNHRIFLNNWDIIDVTVPKILGPYFLKRNRKVLYRLIKSKSLWDRRIALMTTFEFIRNADFEDTLKFCEIVLDDKEDLIHKASGWMLREVGKRKKAKLIPFLNKYHAKMPRTMLRYAIEKLPAPEREKYLKRS